MRTRPLNVPAIGMLVFCLGLGSQASGQSGIVTTVAGNGAQGFAGDGGRADAASLFDPESVAADASGNLFIADTFNNRIRKVSAGGIITTVAGNGTRGFSGDGGMATSAELYYPHGVAVDTSGNLFIADTFNNRIRRVSAGGIITTVAGGGTGALGDNGPAISASLNSPTSVAVDTSGNLFIADAYNNRIRKVSATGIIATVAGNGARGFSGDGGSSTSASFDTPFGVAVDSSGNLFIADTSNNRVRKVSASGIISTVAGNGAYGLAGDGGTAISASLETPSGVTVDNLANIFIADTYSDRIRTVSTGGIITTVAGTGDDGGLVYPGGVAVNASGNLFIADTENNRIREVSVAASSDLPVAIPLPAAVNSVHVNPSTNQVYVGGNINNVVQNIVWINGNTNRIVKSLGVGQGLHVNPATNKIYSADLYAGHILVYSGSDGSLLNTISTFGCPVEAVVDTSLNHIWGAGQCGGGNDPAFLIDGSTNTLISGYIGSGGVMGGATAVNPATHALYMSIGGVEKEVNAATLAVTNAPFSASVVAFNLLPASMYGADSSGKNVVVINYGAESVVATLPVSQTGAIAVNPTRNRVYAVDLSASPQAIKVFAGGSNTLIGSIPLRAGDQACCSMAVNSSSGTIYLPVVNAGSPFLLVIADALTSNPSTNPPVLTSLLPSTAVAGEGALTVTVNGAGFVSGSVVQWNGAALTTTFLSATQLTAALPASDLASVGTAQVSVTNGAAATSNAVTFIIQLPAPNGPVITSLSPPSVAPLGLGSGIGVAFLPLVVNGTGFVPASVVQWNGTNQQTTFVSSSQLKALIAGDQIPGSTSTVLVTVSNPAPGGGISIAFPYSIDPVAAPVITGLSPSAAPAGTSFQLTITGWNFNARTVARWNGSNRPTTSFFDPHGQCCTLYAAIPASDMASVGTAQVTVFNAGAPVSNAATFTIQAANPSGAGITSVTTAYGPATIAQNTFIVIKGNNLVPASTPASGAIWSTAPSFASGQMPTQLGGVSVTVNNKPAFVYFYCSAATDPACAQDQLNILTPLDNTVGAVPVVVTSGAISSLPFNVNMQAVAPSFLLNTVAGDVVGTHANNSPVGPVNLYPGVSTPAAAGEGVALYAVGFGLPATPVANGSANQSGALPVLPVCQIGGLPATVAFAGIISPGLDQLNVTIPGAAANGQNLVSCTYNGATTPAGDLIAVQSSTPTPTLSITTLGVGAVVTSPQGTSCGLLCFQFPAGTVVTVTGLGNSGWIFAGWSGACTGSGSCVLTMSSSQSVTAMFNGQGNSTGTVYQTGFEAPVFSVGPINGQDSWAISGAPGASVIESSVVKTGSQAVGISPAGSSSGVVGAIRSVSYAAANQVLTFSVDAELGATGTPSFWTVLQTQYNSSSPNIGINIDQSGQIHVFVLGTDHATGITITRGVWNTYRLQVSFVNNIVNAYYNNTQVLQNTSISPTGSTLVLYGFYAQGLSPLVGTDTGYFDNLSVAASTNNSTPTLVSVAITPSNSTVAVGASLQLMATGSYSDGSTQNLTNSASWSSSNTGIATVNAAGLVSGVKPGSGTISANSGTVTGTTGVTVGGAAQTPMLTITTAGAGSGTISASSGGTSCGAGCLSFAAGTVVTLTATANPGSTFAGWSGACAGTGGCSVTMNANQTATAAFNLTVNPTHTIRISPTAATIQTGETQQFTATVTGATNSAVTWSVNSVVGGNSSVGTISSNGLYTGPAAVPNPKTVTVTAASLADTSVSAAATEFINPACQAPAAAMSDANGSATICAGGFTFPIQIVDEDTGNSIPPGAAVAVAIDPLQPGRAVLLIAGNSQGYPFQFVFLQSPSQAQSAARPAVLREQAEISGSTSISIPAERGTVNARTSVKEPIQTSALGTVPPPPPTPAPPGALETVSTNLATLVQNGIQSLKTLSDANLPTFLRGPISIQTSSPIPVQNFLGQFIGIVGGRIKGGAEEYVIGTTTAIEYPSLANLITNKGNLGTAIELTSDLLLEYQGTIWLLADANTVTIKTISIGNNPVTGSLIDLYVLLPSYTSSPNDFFASAPNLHVNAGGEGGVELISKTNLGVANFGVLDANGTADIPVPAGDYSMRVSGTGFSPVTQDVSVPPQGTAVNVVRTPLSGGGGSVTGTWSGNFTEFPGCPFAGTLTLTLTQAGTAVTGILTATGTLQSTSSQIIAVCGLSLNDLETVKGSLTGSALSLTSTIGSVVSATVSGNTMTNGTLKYLSSQVNFPLLTKH